MNYFNPLKVPGKILPKGNIWDRICFRNSAEGESAAQGPGEALA